MTYDSKHTEILSPEEWYNITKDEYKKYWPHLNTFYSIDFNRFVPRVRKDYRVLDLWAWDWRMYEQLKKINPDDYVACDCAKELLSKHPWRIKKVVCDLEKDRPFEDESFDLLSAFFLLEHIEDIEHWSINWRRFKIEQFPHTIEDLENQAKEAWFKTGVMQLRDVCDNKLVTGHLLVCEKN